ncbi:ArsA family ATPase [candidate division CSSED10-310 bacterium]|uniref:ArsA family ATPase n=1 Tax=candidate division CSSED10-310 bacterium TaxID=2855610 RepID=A0ABV6YVX7_UNCC1
MSKRLIINLGKGGVGKSVISAAMALVSARRGLRTLLVQLHAKDRISEYLETNPINENIRELQPNLFCVNIVPEAAMREYALIQVKLEVIYKVVFQNRVVKAFLNAVPALSDLVMIGKIEFHVQETLPSGEARFEVIIVDAPPTGHGLFFLSVPKVMADADQTGPIKTHALRIFELLQDPGRCAINLISLPEEMPVSEVIDASAYLEKELHIQPAMLLINRCSPIEFKPEDEETLNQMLRIDKKPRPADLVLQAFQEDISRTKQRMAHAQRLYETLALPMVSLPDLTSFRFSRAELEELAEHLEEIL